MVRVSEVPARVDGAAMTPWYRQPALVSKTPIVAVVLLELANVSQLTRMWSTGTADGQSVVGWMCVNVALLLWLNFYLTFTPTQRWAIWGTVLGIGMNTSVILSVLWLRWGV
jgi:uncharacterized protein with PQ loop repeat